MCVFVSGTATTAIYTLSPHRERGMGEREREREREREKELVGERKTRSGLTEALDSLGNTSGEGSSKPVMQIQSPSSVIVSYTHTHSHSHTHRHTHTNTPMQFTQNHCTPSYANTTLHQTGIANKVNHQIIKKKAVSQEEKETFTQRPIQPRDQNGILLCMSLC